MKRQGLAAALYVSLVFLSGAVVGIFGDRLYTAKTVNANVNGPRPADYRNKYVDEMTQRLRLSPEQVTQLGSILDDTRNKFHEEHNRSKQQLAQIHDEQVQKIHEILVPAQLPEYEKFRAEREKDRELREKNGKDKQPKQ
jgi:Spy/CpxP family protein refolding chaperone